MIIIVFIRANGFVSSLMRPVICVSFVLVFTSAETCWLFPAPALPPLGLQEEVIQVTPPGKPQRL